MTKSPSPERPAPHKYSSEPLLGFRALIRAAARTDSADSKFEGQDFTESLNHISAAFLLFCVTIIKEKQRKVDFSL